MFDHWEVLDRAWSKYFSRQTINMYYRLVLEEGMNLINMRQVREVLLRGKVLTIYFPTITDGKAFSHGKMDIGQTYTFTTDIGAKTEFEKIQKFLESAKAPLG